MTNEIKQYSLEAVIDRFEGKFAVFKVNGQELFWPIKNLPDDAKEGSVVRLYLSTSKTEEEEKEKIAKKILEEILKTE
jgi:hypothetical protein